LRICLFGGTFDPLHIGHLCLAESVLNQINVDKVFFIPASNPPHKNKDTYNKFAHRYKMLELSIRDRGKFFISDIEELRNGISYSVDTIGEFREKFRLKREDIYFLIGSDSLINFDKWKEPQQILSLAQILVAPRPTFEKEKVKAEYLSQVQFLHAPFMDVSSNMIRKLIRDGKSIRYLVSREVENYIYSNKLYVG